MFVKPVAGGTVRDPHTMQLLPEDGAEVSSSDPYWVQRVAHGDVVVTEAPDQD